MDQREREAEKRYRTKKDTKYKTKSLTLEKKVVHFLDNEVKKTEDKNMSKFIEENVKITKKIPVMPKRRKFGTFPIKKTFTFTEDFVKAIEVSGNATLFIEESLIKKFNIL